MSNLFDNLALIYQRPKPFEFYTTQELWADPYISKQMLALHTSDNIELASRKKEDIERSVAWIANHFHVNQDVRICDFGCGPGLYTNRLAKHDALVTGIDVSKTSIEYARSKAHADGLPVEYILDDYLTYSTDKKFNLITMIYLDFCVLNPEQRGLLLKKFHDFLDDGGKLLLDVNSYNRFDAATESITLEYSQKDGFWSPAPYYVFHRHLKYDQEKLLLDKFTIVDQDVIRKSYNWHQCYTLETITTELQKHGLKVIEHYANVSGGAYTDRSKEIAIVAVKDT